MKDNIILKSIDRQAGTSTNFTIYSTLIIEGKYILKYAMIPNTVYPVNESNRRFILQEGAVSYPILLSVGNYNFDTFAVMVADTLTTAGAQAYTVVIDESTYKVSVMAPGVFNLNLTSGSRVRALLGFDDEFPQVTNVGGTFTTTGSGVVNLASPESLGIMIKQSSTRGYENIATDVVGTMYLPLNAETGSYVALSSLDLPQYIEFKSRERQLDIRIVDTSSNELVSLNGGNFELLLTHV
jgi:hypothetical protein